jgi:hypothetical protein
MRLQQGCHDDVDNRVQPTKPQRWLLPEHVTHSVLAGRLLV